MRQGRIREYLDEMEAEAEAAAVDQQEKIARREERRKAGEKHLGRNPLSPKWHASASRGTRPG